MITSKKRQQGFFELWMVLIAILLIAFGTWLHVQRTNKSIAATEKAWTEMAADAKTPSQRLLVAWLKDQCKSTDLVSGNTAKELAWRKGCIRRRATELLVKNQPREELQSDIVALGLDPQRIGSIPAR